MSVRQANLLAAIIVLLVGCIFVTFSIPIYSNRIGGGPGAGVFPFWVGLVVIFGGVIYFWQSIQSAASQKVAESGDPNRKWLFLQVAISLIAYIALMPYLGFALASFLLLFFHLRFAGGYGSLFSVLFSIVTSILLVYCFEVLLYTSLPQGFIGW